MLLRRLRIHLQCRRPQFDSWVTQIPWRRDRLPTPVFLGFPGDSEDKESACKAGDLGSIPGLGRSSRGGHGNPLRILAWRISMDRGAWQAMGPQRVNMTKRLSLCLELLAKSIWQFHIIIHFHINVY